MHVRRARHCVCGPSWAAILSLAGSLWPAWRAVRRSLAVTTRFSSGMTDSVSSRVSRVLLSSELAVATIVMIGTLFIGLGIWRYLNQPLGFDTGDRFTVSLAHHPDYKQATPEEVQTVYAAIRSVPAVKAAGPRSLPRSRGATVEVPGVTIDHKATVRDERAAGLLRSDGPAATRRPMVQQLWSSRENRQPRSSTSAWPGSAWPDGSGRWQTGPRWQRDAGRHRRDRDRCGEALSSRTPYPQLYITAPGAAAAETAALALGAWRERG